MLLPLGQRADHTAQRRQALVYSLGLRQPLPRGAALAHALAACTAGRSACGRSAGAPRRVEAQVPAGSAAQSPLPALPARSIRFNLANWTRVTPDSSCSSCASTTAVNTLAGRGGQAPVMAGQHRWDASCEPANGTQRALPRPIGAAHTCGSAMSARSCAWQPCGGLRRPAGSAPSRRRLHRWMAQNWHSLPGGARRTSAPQQGLHACAPFTTMCWLRFSTNTPCVWSPSRICRPEAPPGASRSLSSSLYTSQAQHLTVYRTPSRSLHVMRSNSWRNTRSVRPHCGRAAQLVRGGCGSSAAKLHAPGVAPARPASRPRSAERRL